MLYMEETLYPNFHGEAIDVIAGSARSPHWITSFQLRIKGKRKDDLVIFGLGRQGNQSEVWLYENPQNLEFDEGIQDESLLTMWNKLALHSLRQPSSCISTDITGNGLNDLIVTYEYGESLNDLDPYGGRVCWLENFGTNEGDWSCHEIGRFPGVNCVKVGHFSTTYSLQLLAVVKSSRMDVSSPLVIFTRPPDVYNSRYWLVATALENDFSAVQDCVVIPSTRGALDDILISSREGLSVAWYYGRSWKCEPLDCIDFPSDFSPGKLCVGRVGRDPASFIVCSEANGGARLAILTKVLSMDKYCQFHEASWMCLDIANFAGGNDGSILDILCEDLDGNGNDEIIVSVCSKGPNTGLYYFVLDGDSFMKYKLCDEPATKVTTARFNLKTKIDLALLTCSNPCSAMVLHHAFIPSQIRPSIEDSELVLYVPHIPRYTSEVDIIDIAGYTISLVVLPPNASYDIVPDGSESLKVLHGLLGWIDSQAEVIERTRVSCGPGCVASVLVDSPEGHVRSGDDGAVFVRLRPSSATDAIHLKALNVLPSYFPCDARDYKFCWQHVEQSCMNSSPNDDRSGKLNHLSGFRVQFDPFATSERNTEDMDIAFIHFYAAAPSTSTGFMKGHAPTSFASDSAALQQLVGRREAQVCSIRTSLSNPSGESGLIYCDDPFDRFCTTPTPFQISRARRLILPVMYEHGPFWHSTEVVDEKRISAVNIEYPWHAWVSGRVGKARREQIKWDVWAVFDFPAFGWPQSSQNGENSCTIC